MANISFVELQAKLGEYIAELPHNTRLPSEPELAKSFGVSRATLREAMRMFETQGLIRRRQGSGTFVVGNSILFDSGLEVLESMLTLARRTGHNIGPGPVKIVELACDEEIAAQLECPVGSPLIRISRTMSAEDRPVAYLVDILPASVLTPDEIDKKFDGSVLDFLIHRGDALTLSYTRITAENADSRIARKLEIQRGDVVLKFEARLFTQSGKVVDFTYSYFLPGYFDFHIVRRVERHIEKNK